jgi:GNAT superfamily N-acetyltransferase
MQIIVRPVSGPKEMKQFVKFRIDLYRDSPYAIPPLYMDEMGTLDPKKNPAFQFCEAQCFMAFAGDKPVGRICAMVNHRANEVWKSHSGRFGFVDFIDDEAVSKALFTAAENWVKAKGMHSIHGPLGFTDLDQEGMLVEGFDQMGTMATIYNHPYYPLHVEKLGYVKDADWVEYKITIPDAVPDRMRRISELVLKKNKLRILKYSSASKLIKDGYVQALFELVNDSYGPLYGFTPLTQAQIDYYTKLYIPMLKLDFLVLVVDEAGKLVGFGVVMPSLSQALRKAQGNLFPFGLVHVLKALKLKNPLIDCLLVAVRKDYQNKGVNALFFYDMIPYLKKAGAKYAESNPELAANTKVQSQWDDFEHVNHKRRRAFLKELG